NSNFQIPVVWSLGFGIFRPSLLHCAPRLALRANAEDLQRVRHICVAKLPRHALEPIGHAEVERLDAMTGATDDVVMMMVAGVELVAIRAVAEIASAHEIDLLHRRDAAIHSHQ